MKSFSWLAMLICAVAFIPTAGAQTADIIYSTNQLSSDPNIWLYSYSVTNTTPAGAALPAIDEFTIYYSLGTFSNMTIVSSPSNWGSLVAQPDPNLMADGFLDAEALDAGLPAGAMQTGFSVNFTFLGQGTPGSQLFNIVDFNNPATYADPLQVGFTRLGGSVVSAPEIDASSALGAMTLLMGGLLVLRGRKDPAKTSGVRRFS